MRLQVVLAVAGKSCKQTISPHHNGKKVDLADVGEKLVSTL